ncbi:protease modulator HflC [Alteriqipengyuania flavescens]|uniref:protease modulator HflC n=1 Tax=Alteriqipengyuania flavescens TaxID=3053610 RepID=UPI0025B2C80C|nr:protease modulator HflC [Alteriqipengyuania flavescens]WJY19268.1 protease modulator HflC [Alteriqipengyuania flavescens]WJY25209.1 protease modulator HflC [Alteriqipengyuania flavescens]
MEKLWTNHKLSVIAVIALLVLFAMSAFIVPEEKQAVVIRTGEPVYTYNTAGGSTGSGLWLKLPIVDQVELVEKRILDLDMTDQEVLSSDQQRLVVNAYARFRIVNPVRMVERAGNEDGVRTALEPILNSVLRQELGRRTFQAMLTAERGSALANVRANLDRQARQYGAEVIDVQIKRTDLPEGDPLQAAFERMRSDRQREAQEIRAEGDRDARIIRAEADAEAARIYAEAFGKDPGFYDFYRAMQSYDQTFRGEGNTGESSIILSPDNEYLNRFRNPGQ